MVSPVCQTRRKIGVCLAHLCLLRQRLPYRPPEARASDRKDLVRTSHCSAVAAAVVAVAAGKAVDHTGRCLEGSCRCTWLCYELPADVVDCAVADAVTAVAAAVVAVAAAACWHQAAKRVDQTVALRLLAASVHLGHPSRQGWRMISVAGVAVNVTVVNAAAVAGAGAVTASAAAASAAAAAVPASLQACHQHRADMSY